MSRQSYQTIYVVHFYTGIFSDNTNEGKKYTSFIILIL